MTLFAAGSFLVTVSRRAMFGSIETSAVSRLTLSRKREEPYFKNWPRHPTSSSRIMPLVFWERSSALATKR